MTISTRTLALATTALLALSGQALAHAHLKTATPAANDTVAQAQAPAELTLTFSEGVNPRLSGVTLTGPDKKAVATGEATLAPAGDTVLKVPVSAPLAAGTYTVQWHALATDGHKTTGNYTFTVKP